MWQDRIREAAYTSPVGTRTIFGGYEDVSMSAEKKTTAFDFPDADGTYIQDLGPKGRRYPLRVFFWGNDYDIQSNAFFDSLLEVGTGKLEHPVYGVVSVVPFGRIKRRDDLVTAANQAVFELEFWETNSLIYPIAQEDLGGKVVSSVSEFNQEQVKTFKLQDLSTAIKKVSFRNDLLSKINYVSDSLLASASLSSSVLNDFINTRDSIIRNVNTASLLTMGYQSLTLLQAPSKSGALPSAYDNLLLLDAPESVNQLRLNDLFATGALAASILSAVKNKYISKTQAIESAEKILSQFDKVNLWRETAFNVLGEIDTGEAYEKLQEAVALLTAHLVRISFSLLQEKSIIIDRDRTIIDLCAELYGEIDGTLDFFINTNNLSGSEILELKRGREIVYYV